MSSNRIRFLNVSQPGTWYVTAALLGNPDQSRTGGQSASASSGGGGWQIIDRSRRKAATEWFDYYPYVMHFTCMLTGAQLGGTPLTPASVEGWITTLESFEIPTPGSSPPQPPILTVSGPVQHTDAFWVCSALTFPNDEGSVIRNTSAQRTQQTFTIELTEFSPSYAIAGATLPPAVQAALTSSTTTGPTALSSGHNYTVVVGDTFQSIAATQLGNVTLWPTIPLINGLPNSTILVPGTTLIIPG